MQALRIYIIVLVDTVKTQNVFGVAALTGTGIADIDGLALQVRNAVDAGIGAGHQQHRLRMHAKDAAQILHRFAFPVAAAAESLGIAIGLSDAEIEQGTFHGANVEHRAQRRTADTVIIVAIMLIDQIAYVKRDLIIDTGY